MYRLPRCIIFMLSWLSASFHNEKKTEVHLFFTITDKPDLSYFSLHANSKCENLKSNVAVVTSQAHRKPTACHMWMHGRCNQQHLRWKFAHNSIKPELTGNTSLMAYIRPSLAQLDRSRENPAEAKSWRTILHYSVGQNANNLLVNLWRQQLSIQQRLFNYSNINHVFIFTWPHLNLTREKKNYWQINLSQVSA